MTYAIWCEVWGGITGSRASWAKQDGKVMTFATLEAAEAEAKQRQARTMGNLNRTAHFAYTARTYR